MDGFTDQFDGIDLRPAVVATCVWVGVGLALDAYLLVRRKDNPDCPLITDVLRTKPGKIGLAVLGLHVVNCLGKADPFRAAAAVVTRRIADAADTATTVLTDALPGE